MIDLNDVALFAKVVQSGSFSGAARALGMPKATVSRNVARLESEVGARLLHRTTRKTELTAQGRAYFEEATRGLAHLHSAGERLAAAQAEPSGILRVTAPVYYGIHYLVNWIAEFAEICDKVSIELKLTDSYVNLVEERIDLAFRTGNLASSSFVGRKLAPTRRVMVASPLYLQRRSDPRSVEDLLLHDCIILGQSLDHPVWRLEGPEGATEVHVQGRIAVDSAHAALRATVAGLGISLLPSGTVAADLQAGHLHHVMPELGAEGGGLFVIYPSNRHISAALRAFLDFVIEKYQ